MVLLGVTVTVPGKLINVFLNLRAPSSVVVVTGLRRALLVLKATGLPGAMENASGKVVNVYMRMQALLVRIFQVDGTTVTDLLTIATGMQLVLIVLTTAIFLQTWASLPIRHAVLVAEAFEIQKERMIAE